MWDYYSIHWIGVKITRHQIQTSRVSSHEVFNLFSNNSRPTDMLGMTDMNFDCCVQFKLLGKRAVGAPIYSKEMISHVVAPHLDITYRQLGIVT